MTPAEPVTAPTPDASPTVQHYVVFDDGGIIPVGSCGEAREALEPYGPDGGRWGRWWLEWGHYGPDGEPVAGMEWPCGCRD